MSPELTEVILHILTVLAFFMSVPLVWKIFFKLARFISNLIDPIKIIEIETIEDDGSTTTQIIKLDNTDELVQALLKKRAKNV